MTNKTTHGLTNKQQANNTQTNNKQEYKNDKNIYYIILNKYKEQLSKSNFFERLKIIKRIKESNEYGLLTTEEKYQLDNSLIGGNYE